jgi:hypothetical protein
MVEIPVMLLWLLGTLVFSVGIAVGFMIERQCHVPWKADTLETLAANARRMALDIAELREALHVAKGEDEEAK